MKRSEIESGKRRGANQGGRRQDLRHLMFPRAPRQYDIFVCQANKKYINFIAFFVPEKSSGATRGNKKLTTAPGGGDLYYSSQIYTTRLSSGQALIPVFHH